LNRVNELKSTILPGKLAWGEGLSFDVEGLHIEVGLKTEVGVQHPRSPSL